MAQTLSELLSFAGEPALLVRKGKIAYLNAAARRELGECTGEAAAARLGLDPGRVTARMYLADTRIDGKSYILRVSRVEDGRLIFLKPETEAPPILNDAFLYCLRSNLMTLGLAADKLRPALEDQGSAEMRADLTALTAGYFKLMRLSDNASLVHDFFARRAVASPAALDMSLLCHALLDAVEEHFPRLSIVRDIPGGLRLNADARLLRQLLFNLLANCLVHAQAKVLRFRLSETRESVVVTLADDGCGIPPEELAGVFERYRFGFGLGELGKGVGLGLTAARAVTQLHGGTLLLESQPGHGTVIHASFSKRTPADRLGGSEALCTMRDVLLGLADCLPPECFEEKYLD